MSDIKNFDIRAHIIDAIIEVFNSMVSMEVELFDSDPPDNAGKESMAATVNFAGNVVGMLNIQVDSALSRQMLAGKLDIKPEEVEDEGQFRNLLAEISTLVSGNLLSSLNNAGHRCAISQPFITYGDEFRIKPVKMERLERIIFAHQENYISVEVGLKPQQDLSDEDLLAETDARPQLSEADIAKVNALDAHTRGAEAVIDVFDSMLSVKLERSDATAVDSLEGTCHAVSVSFAGDAAGMVSIYVEDSFARDMAAKRLGSGVEEVGDPEELRDMLAEMVNTAGANLISGFTDAGLGCTLCTPALVTGAGFKFAVPGLENYERFAFRCDANNILLEIGAKVAAGVLSAVKPDDSPAAKPVSSPAQAPENEPVETRNSKVPEDVDLDLLLDIPLEIKVELGRARIEIRKLLNLAPGSAIKLIKLEGEPVDILVNDTLIARGDVIVQNEKYGIRVTEITSRMDRIRSFSL